MRLKDSLSKVDAPNVKGDLEDEIEQEGKAQKNKTIQSAVEATTLGLKTKSGLKPNSTETGGLYTV